MDNHGSQRTATILKMYEQLGMLPIFTSANCTDCISPVDHHVGRYIQNHMGSSYREAVEKNPEVWIASSSSEELDDPSCRSAMSRRILMAKWLSAAWHELTENHAGMIETAFVETGFKIAKDGSEDHLIQIQGWSRSETYSYRT